MTAEVSHESNPSSAVKRFVPTIADGASRDSFRDDLADFVDGRRFKRRVLEVMGRTELEREERREEKASELDRFRFPDNDVGDGGFEDAVESGYCPSAAPGRWITDCSTSAWIELLSRELCLAWTPSRTR